MGDRGGWTDGLSLVFHPVTNTPKTCPKTLQDPKTGTRRQRLADPYQPGGMSATVSCLALIHHRELNFAKHSTPPKPSSQPTPKPLIQFG